MMWPEIKSLTANLARRRAAILAALFTAFAAYACGLAITQSDALPAARPWGQEYLPNVAVVDHHGRQRRFYDDVLAGKIVVVSFIYTSCKSVCPLAIARLREVQDRLGERMGKDIHFASISIDPIPDTPEKLRKHAAAFDVKPGWDFLTGDIAAIDEIRQKLGERSGRAIEQHRNEILLYNDATGRWGRDSAFSDIAVLASNILAMDPNHLATVEADQTIAEHVAVDEAVVGRQGQALFAKACSTCHTIGGGAKVGPDLANVTERRGHDWVKSYMMAPESMRSRADATAMELRRAYPDVRMPTLGISDGDAEDLMAYIDSRSAGARAAKSH